MKVNTNEIHSSTCFMEEYVFEKLKAIFLVYS